MQELIIKSSKYPIKLDDEDFERISKFTWTAGGTNNFGIKSSIGRQYMNNGKNIYVPIANEVMRVFDVRYDHIDKWHHNNQKNNLRICTNSQNQANTEKILLNKKSAYRGVTRSRHKWKAQISILGKNVYLGLFKTQKEAAICYNKAAIDTFGEFAVINNLNETTN